MQWLGLLELSAYMKTLDVVIQMEESQDKLVDSLRPN